MSKCTTCEGKTYREYYDTIAICADCSDALSIADVVRKIEAENAKLKERIEEMIYYIPKIGDKSQDARSEIKQLKEQLKNKTQREVDASVNKDCLDGCRALLVKAREEIETAKILLRKLDGLFESGCVSSLGDKEHLYQLDLRDQVDDFTNKVIK